MLSLLLFGLLFLSVKSVPSSATNDFQKKIKGGIQEDLKDFVNIIPTDDIRNLTKYYYASDPAMRSSYDYLRDDGFQRILNSLSTLTLVKKFTNFLTDKGVVLSEIAQHFEKIVLTVSDCAEIAGNFKLHLI